MTRCSRTWTAFWGKSWGRSEREDSKTRYFQCGMNARQRLCGYCPHPRAPGALALSLDRERDLEKHGEGKRSSQTPGFVSFCSPQRSSDYETLSEMTKVASPRARSG